MIIEIKDAVNEAIGFRSSFGETLIEAKHNAEFKPIFKNLDDSKKWHLLCGKCVDNELLIGMQCREDYPGRSLIMDPYDESYILYEILTREELEEIKSYNHKPLPPASTELKGP